MTATYLSEKELIEEIMLVAKAQTPKRGQLPLDELLLSLAFKSHKELIKIATDLNVRRIHV